MRMSPECVPCLVRRVLFEAEEWDPSKAHEAVRVASEMLGELFGDDVCSAGVASKVHRAVYDVLGTDDPYADLKAKGNEVALELYPAAERFVAGSRDRLRAAFLCAVVGNVLDFGIGTAFDHPAALRKEFKNLLDEGLGHDDTPRVRKLLSKADRIVYLVDNCGEVVLDRLALKQIKKFDVEVTLAVKGEPILSDATLADIHGLGIEELVDRVVETPGFAVGVDLGSLEGEFGRMLRDSDLVIAKGMGNFEALSETDIAPVAYMLRTKCRPVADAMGLPKDINAVKLFARRRSPR
ncbi:MAG: ARMT1-like domain-containing protein [Thermoplasmata archaeon]|nr:ARMT1-like domain-containing protein [Thermoplasmata archaeon]